MALWVILAAMAALALGLLLPPLLRRAPPIAARQDFDSEIYRDQLTEIERDVARELIGGAEAEAARAEVSRRLLAAQAGPAGDQPAEGSAGLRRGMAALVAILVPAAALAVYLNLGSPRLVEPAVTTARPGPALLPDTTGETTGPDMAALVIRLADKLKERPYDAKGWALYARSLAGLGRFDEAVPAFRRATGLAPRDVALTSQFAEAMIHAAGGTVTPAARAALEATLALAPGEPRARYYLGLADRQAGRRNSALGRWLALAADTPAVAPWRTVLNSRIEKLAVALGIDAAKLAAMRAAAAGNRPAPSSAPAPAPGPSAADVTAARSMSAGDRSAMIRTMVARLAERLRNQPDDGAGWRRLGRSYRVLGDGAKSRDAYARAAKLLPGDVAVLAEYAAALARTAQPDQKMPAELVRVTGAILKLDGDDRNALWLAGIARLQADDAAGARLHWQRLLGLLAPGTPQYERVKKRLGN